MSSSAIFGLAFLQVNWDERGQDYVETFVPLIAECLRRSNATVVSLPDLQTNVKDNFGLKLPQNAIRVILQRAAKRKYVELENHVFYVNKQKCDHHNFRATQERVTAIHSRVTTKLQAYVSREHQHEWTVEQTETAIHDFLRDNSLSLIFSLAENSFLLDRSTHSSKTAYLVGSFLEEIKSNDQLCLQDFEILVQGNLLANALYFPDPGRIAKRFRGTKVYLDTSIIVYACGFVGADRAAPPTELLALLTDYGARLSCFPETVNEVRGILDACASRIQKGNLKHSYGPSMEYFIESGKTASDIELMSARLINKLQDMRISVDRKPDYDHAYQIDEVKLEAALDEALHYKNPKARIHDVDCISSIARLRRGRELFLLEDTKAFFVTANIKLARATRMFFQSESTPGAVALCLTDYALGNLLWLKNPTKAPNLPRKQLLADAYAVVQPSEQLWMRYLIRIAKLRESGEVTPDQYYLLRHSLAAKAALMDLTEGDEASFSEGTVQEILETATRNVQSTLKQDLQAEQERLRLANAELETLRNNSFSQQQRVRDLANRVAFGTRKVVFFLVAAGVAIASLFTFPWDLPTPQSGWPAYAFTLLLTLVFVLFVCNHVWGTTVVTLMDRFEQFVAEKVQNGLFAVFPALNTNR